MHIILVRAIYHVLRLLAHRLSGAKMSRLVHLAEYITAYVASSIDINPNVPQPNISCERTFKLALECACASQRNMFTNRAPIPQLNDSARHNIIIIF